MADFMVARMDAASIHRDCGTVSSTALKSISDRGYSCYQPKFRIRTASRGRKVWLEKFLFGPYLFVELVADWLNQFVDVSQARGVAGVLVRDEKLLVAREHEVERIRSREVRGFFPPPKFGKFLAGERVMILEGAFAKNVATYRGRVPGADVVLLELFGKLNEVHIPSGRLVSI